MKWISSLTAILFPSQYNNSNNCVQDYPGEPVPKETFIHSHLTWSLTIPYQLPSAIASSPFNLHAWQYFCTTSLQVLFGLPHTHAHTHTHTHTHTQPFYSPLEFCPGLPRWAGTRKVKPGRWNESGFNGEEIVSGNGISWAICISAPWPRHITMPASHHSVFYRPDALPATEPTASKHWRQWQKDDKTLW